MKINAIIERLQSLIEIPSFSREEDQTADFLCTEFEKYNIPCERIGNNVLARNKHLKDHLPVFLLNSHHDTVRPASTYTRDPFKATLENGKLYGLGSNDAGASLCTLFEIFMAQYSRKDLPFNLLFIGSAEEEISGAGGIQKVLAEIKIPWAGIVGEPTQMMAAVAERGLMVIDGKYTGVSGHAARKEGINALYGALDDIQKIRNIIFDRHSEYLPETQVVVTQIEAGTQHNVIPDVCSYVVDVRINDRYSNQEVFKILKNEVSGELDARSFRLNSSLLPEDHLLFEVVRELDLRPYGSPTLSDQALMHFPTLKIGPGNSARSHTADEFVYISEIEAGYRIYTDIIETLIKKMS